MSALAARRLALPRVRLGLRRVRRLVQVASLLGFLYLAVATTVPLPAATPVDLFLRIDPLAQLVATLAGRQVAPYAAWALVVALLTVALGRAFCGWVCPLGTTLDAFRLDARARRLDYPRLRPTKHFVLLLTLVGAMLGVATLAVLDPITLYLRALGTALLPGLNLAATAALTALYQAGVAPDLVVEVDAALRATLLPAEQHAYRLGILMLGLLVGIVALNLLTPRFWCRYLCPLGALLGVIGRLSPLQKRLGPECDRCARCVAQCKMGAIAAKTLKGEPAECVQCFDCADECPQGALTVGLGWQEPHYSPSRRQFLAAVGLGVAGVVALRTDASAIGQDAHLIRPPGATDDFLQRCIRCGECIRVCPTSALQPAMLEAGWEGFWTPVVVPRLGNCDWTCNACGQVCPTGAIQPLGLEAKREVVIGTAYFDQNRCIPWADGRDCIVCQEMCPLPEKAIVLDEVELAAEGGGKRILKRPRMLRELCIGCGACENRCPLPRESAVRVYSIASSGRERTI